MLVRPLEPDDLEGVVTRVAEQLAHDGARNSLINPTFSREEFASSLARVRDQTWVAIEGTEVVGHLYAAVLENDEYGCAAWVGPDGVSFDEPRILVALYAEASSTWSDRGAREHYVWVLDEIASTRPWIQLGFSRAHVRGALSLSTRPPAPLPDGYELRLGDLADLEVALTLDRALDEAEHRVAGSATVEEGATRREEWRELLADDEVRHYLVEAAGETVAQCVTYPMAPQRGSFDGTLHLSAVVVLPPHEHLGVGRALVGAALSDAERAGFRFAEASWRVTNRRASDFWRHYGFRRTYVRLRGTTSLD